MEVTFNSAETNTSMPQNGKSPETTYFQNNINPQEDSNEVSNGSISDTTETDPDFISAGPRESPLLRHWVPPRN